jgi:hypothetical protein
MPKFANSLDLQKNELKSPRLHNLSTDPSSPVHGQMYFNTTDKRIKVYDAVATAWKYASGPFYASEVVDFDTQVRTNRLDQMTAPTASVSLNSQKITNLATPTASTDAATKGYVDSARSGLDVKQSVKAASTVAGGNITLSGEQSIDTIALVAGDRVLLKNQSTASQNGIWIVSASTWSRALDADGTITDGASNVTSGLFCFVEQGDVNRDTGWVLTTDTAITVGTTNLAFAQFTGAGSFTAGAGLTQTGNQLDANTDGTTTYVDSSDQIAVKSSTTAGEVLRSQGTGTSAAWGALSLSTPAAVTGVLPTTNGGTGASTVAGAKTSLGFMTRYVVSIGDGTATSYTVTHNLNTLDVIIQVFENASGEEILTDVARATVNTATVTFSAVATSNQYRVVVIG